MTDRNFARGTYESYPGSDTEPVVQWQISAIGDRELTPGQARDLADWLAATANRSAENANWLEFILLGEDPRDVADHLREAATDAETEVERFEASVEQMQEDMKNNQ